MGYYSAIKKTEILSFATTWMDLEGLMLSEISQTEKDKYHMISLSMRPSRSIHVVANDRISVFFIAE